MGAAMADCGRWMATVRRCFWRGRGEERWVAMAPRGDGEWRGAAVSGVPSLSATELKERRRIDRGGVEGE
uniref:Uncharacterized protein n=1 Tax=Oryza meridionalis TaxID=40149 RepID=A0A0E0E1L3_9ORYZ